MTNAKTFVWTFGLCLLGSGAMAFAESKTAPVPSCTHEHCPIRTAHELSDIKVELTQKGATIQLTAKRAEDVSKLQESAQEIAAALSGGNCMMHMAYGAMHEHPRAHGQPKADTK